MQPKLAHVAERHWRAGAGCLGWDAIGLYSGGADVLSCGVLIVLVARRVDPPA